MATITKRELVKRVCDELGEKSRSRQRGSKRTIDQEDKILTQQEIFDVIQLTMDAIVDELANGNSVILRNFGAFQVKVSKAKIGRNPKNPGKDVPIPPRATVKFKAGKEMKEKVKPVLPKLRERGV